MSIIRAPFTPNRYKGGLDRLVASHLLDKYFETGHRILDPMAGSKMVEYEAKKLGIYCKSNDIKDPGGWDACGDWPVEDHEFNGVILHPPYFRAKKYSDDTRDIGNIKNIDEYIMTIAKLIKEAKRVTIPKGYIILIIGDYRKSSVMRMVHAEIYMWATRIIHPAIGELALELENYDLWEISATGTPFVSTKHMMMLNWCMAFRRPPKKLEAFL